MKKKTLPKSNVISSEQKRITGLIASDMSIINHDLMGHISPIKMCAEILKSHICGTLNEKQERMVETIQRCVDKSELLIKDLSDAYELELHLMQLSKTELGVNDLMDECVGLLQSFIVEKQVELKIEVGTSGQICVDKNRITQVIVHLVKNAIDFVPEIGGKIIIKIAKDQSNLLFFVEDNGDGIKSEDLDKIFDKFYKGISKHSRKYGGSGLGLTLCKGIIEAHGGQIWVDTTRKNGSLFMFTIPLMSA